MPSDPWKPTRRPERRRVGVAVPPPRHDGPERLSRPRRADADMGSRLGYGPVPPDSLAGAHAPSAFGQRPEALAEDGEASAISAPPGGDRTEALVSNGRSSARVRRFSRRQGVAAGIAAAVAVLGVVLAVTLPGRGASWPTSVSTMRREAARACQNPDVRSEPDQVNFACASPTRRILWVFALLTSGGRPAFVDHGTGRRGLEPIGPVQGGQLAWSLNLHHPYDPSNPVDSLEVAARAINNIIGGATVTGPDGTPVVQPGLESSPANCARYTGSSAVTSRPGFPARCARRVTRAGRAALVADVYRKWVVGASRGTAQRAVVLFENASNPGAPKVQAILKRLPGR